MNKVCSALLLVCSLIGNESIAERPPGPQHGLELYGTPKYPSDFKHFDYVNPNAPKGGTVRFSTLGTFDSLNPFVIKGVSAAGISMLFPSYLYVTLSMRSYDEPSSVYGYLAETMEIAPDNKSVTFVLRKEAKFHDGTPITAEDVAFTFDTLKSKGNPMFASYYRKISSAEVLGPLKVRFNFAVDDDRELAQIIGEMPILSKKFYKTHDFSKSDLTMPLGNGPYKIESVDAGKSITFSRVKDWWGAKLPVTLGRYNFDTIKMIYFRDPTVALEAFKAGDIDVRFENVAKNWANAYDNEAYKQGEFVKEALTIENPNGMSGVVFNIRKPIFQDPQVRKAIALAFDFEWANKNLFYGYYKRHNSYFSNSVLASSGLPQGEELRVLEPFKDQLPPEVFTQEFKMPVNDAAHPIREKLRTASKLLKEAGWEIKSGVLTNKKSAQPLEFEILIQQPDLERVLNGFIENLKLIGINAKIRVVDMAQYQERTNDFDFDMIMGSFPQSNTPGNEQEEMFGSKAADAKGSRNVMGLKSSVVDSLIEQIIHVQSREQLITFTHALDRVLLWGWYVVPGYYLGAFWIGRWKYIQRPEVMPQYNIDIDTWWYGEQK